MPLRILFVLLLLLMVTYSSTAQRAATISGTISYEESGDVLIGGIVEINNEPALRGISDNTGFYYLTVPDSLLQDSIQITCSYVGCDPFQQKLLLTQDATVDIGMVYQSMNTITVKANSAREKVLSTQMSTEEVTAKQAKNIVSLFGEADIIKVLQLKPGIQSGSEGSTGFYIRGGGGAQNYFSLDGATLYNPSHLLGIFSVFNADATERVTLYKAGFPAEYGGRLSAVIATEMREGNREKLELIGSVGLVASRLAVSGPIQKGKGSFLLAGRLNYVNIYALLINEINKGANIPDPSFVDINAKVNYDIGKNDRLVANFYFGRDQVSFVTQNALIGMSWGNIAATLGWNKLISSKLSTNTSLTFSDYNYRINTGRGGWTVKLNSGIRDIALKNTWLWELAPKHQFKFGAEVIYHHFSVAQFDITSPDIEDISRGAVFDAGDFSIYGTHVWDISRKLKLSLGMRLNAFYNQDTVYLSPEPRVALRYLLHTNTALKLSYARMSQNIHLVSSSGATLPTDIWYPSNKAVQTQFSDQIALGVSHALGKDFYFNVEGYYKQLYNQVGFRDGAQLVYNKNMDKEFIFGTGSSYGAEFYIEKRNGDFRAWLGYTLSWAWDQFAEANQGLPYHPKHDRRHDISAVITWDLPWLRRKLPITLSAAWVYGTGSAITLPTKRFIHTGLSNANPFQFVPVYTKRGNARMPDFHRLDLSVILKLYPLKNKRFKSDLVISIYNVYDRRNPFFVDVDAVYADGPGFSQNAQIPERFDVRVISLFPILPSISWNFKW